MAAAHTELSSMLDDHRRPGVTPTTCRRRQQLRSGSSYDICCMIYPTLGTFLAYAGNHRIYKKALTFFDSCPHWQWTLVASQVAVRLSALTCCRLHCTVVSALVAAGIRYCHSKILHEMNSECAGGCCCVAARTEDH